LPSELEKVIQSYKNTNSIACCTLICSQDNPVYLVSLQEMRSGSTTKGKAIIGWTIFDRHLQ